VTRRVSNGDALSRARVSEKIIWGGKGGAYGGRKGIQKGVIGLLETMKEKEEICPNKSQKPQIIGLLVCRGGVRG